MGACGGVASRMLIKGDEKVRLRLKIKILEEYGSQRKFAQALNNSDDWVSRIITGVREPSEDDRRLILDNLTPGLEERDLFNE